MRRYDTLFAWLPGLGGTSFVTVLVLCAYALAALRSARDARACLMLYMSFCALHVVFIGALFERSENQRFRLLVDPFLLLLTASALQALYQRANAFSRRRA